MSEEGAGGGGIEPVAGRQGGAGLVPAVAFGTIVLPRNCGDPESPVQGLPSLIADRWRIVGVSALKVSVATLRVPAELGSGWGGPPPPMRGAETP